MSEADYNFIPAEIIFDVDLNDVDFFINIASMQEMNIEIINAYFDLIRNQKSDKTYFYCCNRISKKLPDGNVAAFDDYAWLPNDKVIFDEVCTWYSSFPFRVLPLLKI